MVKEFEHQAKQTSVPSTFQLLYECNLVMESYRDSIKATNGIKTKFRKVLTQAEPAEMSLSHMFQRDPYLICNTALRRDADMTHLQPDLVETRRQELRNSLFLSVLLTVGERGRITPYKWALKQSKGFRPYQNQPVVAVATNPSPLTRGTLRLEASAVSLDHTAGTKGASTSTDPPIGSCLSSCRREWLEENCSNKVLNIITNGCLLPFNTKPSVARKQTPYLHRLQKVTKGSSSGHLYSFSTVKECNGKSRKNKVSWILQPPVSSTKAPRIKKCTR